MKRLSLHSFVDRLLPSVFKFVSPINGVRTKHQSGNGMQVF